MIDHQSLGAAVSCEWFARLQMSAYILTYHGYSTISQYGN